MSRIEYTNCIVCGSTDFSEKRSIQDWLVSNETFSLKECHTCSFRFVSDPPAAEDAGAYYETEEYVEHSDNRDGIINRMYHVGRKWMMNYKLKMLKRYSTGTSILDVGSGAGYFLNFMKQNGYQTNGIEISAKAVANCKEKYGIEAFSPSDFMEQTVPGKYDLITMWHVFEHVYQYDEYFKSFENYLTKDGALVIAMPNYYCLEEKHYKNYWNGYDVPRHLWHFTPDTFPRFAADRGFEVVKMHNLPLDPFYNCMISASYKKSPTFLPFTAFVGLLSSIRALFSFQRSSSVVYILRKKT